MGLFLCYSENYQKIIILDYESVDSNQFKTLRNSIQDFGKLLNGKNSIFINAIKSSKNEKLKLLLPYIKNHVCFIFTNENLDFFTYHIQQSEMFDFQDFGSIAEEDILINAHHTNLNPNFTPFFKNVQFVIQGGRIDLLEDFVFVKKGTKLLKFQSEILRKLGMKTKRKKFDIVAIFEDGKFCSPEMKHEELEFLLQESIQDIFQVAKNAGYLIAEKIEIEEYESSSSDDFWSLFF
jgi:ribosomal protein L10